MKNKIKELTPKLIIIFLYCQPFLDIIASILIKNNISNFITSGIRILFMLYLTIYLIIIPYENKKKTLIYIGLLLFNLIIHTSIILIYKDLGALSYEVRNTLSTFYFTFVLLSFMTIYKESNFNKKHLKNIYLIYVILTFIPNILGIGYDSYWHSKVGSAGWFYSANVLGSIIIILLPTILPEFKNDKKIVQILISLITLYVIFSIGTKTPVLGLFLIISTNLIYLFYKKIKEKNKKWIISLTTFIVVSLLGITLILPKTSFYENIQIHLNYLKKQNTNIISKEFLDHFIFSQRLTFENTTRKNYNKSHTLEKIFGIGYIENYATDEVNIKEIEIDYFDIFYREGIIGFILFFIPVIYIITKNLKGTKLTYKKVNKITTISLILLLALFQGHIFITPAVSIFVALILTINSLNTLKKEV